MGIDINNLTLGQVKELSNLLNSQPSSKSTLNYNFVGKKVIIRTYSAGVFFGEIVEKFEDEIILKNARRLYFWKTLNDGISLSEVANAGLHSTSKVCSPTPLHWVKAIEIIICSPEAIENIEGQNEYKA